MKNNIDTVSLLDIVTELCYDYSTEHEIKGTHNLTT